MAEEIVQYQRQAPFIEQRVEKLLASIFGTPAQGVEGEEGSSGGALGDEAVEDVDASRPHSSAGGAEADLALLLLLDLLLDLLDNCMQKD